MIKTKITKTTLPQNFFQVAKGKISKEQKKLLDKFAEELYDELVALVESQALDWEPLSEGYEAYKERKGLDPRIYIATRDFLDNGIDWQVKDGKIAIGPTSRKHAHSDLTYEALALIQEFGTDHIPARPLWRPFFKHVLAKSKKFKKAQQEMMAEALRAKTKKETKRK